MTHKEIAISFVVLFVVVLALAGLNMVHTVIIADLSKRVAALEEVK